METKSFSKRVSIADLWGILTRRIWIMLIAALVVTVGVKIYESQIKVPLYESTATSLYYWEVGKFNSLSRRSFLGSHKPGLAT